MRLDCRFSICFVVSFFLLSCKTDRQRDVIVQIVFEWTGKQIQFPEGIPCLLFDRDTVCLDLYNPTTHKVLLYIDSAGINSVRLRLSEWKQLIAEADSLFAGKVDFLFFYQPKPRDIRELTFLLHKYDFQYPLFLDLENQLDKANRFPPNPSFQCFLLDSDNKVTLIGNPTTNPQIWELYKKQISGEKNNKASLTTIRANPIRLELPGMKVRNTYECKFEIENTGNIPFVISRIYASCGCTVPSWEKQPIAPGGKTEITVEVVPDATGFFNKTIDVYGNMEQSVLKLSIIGTVE